MIEYTAGFEKGSLSLNQSSMLYHLSPVTQERCWQQDCFLSHSKVDFFSPFVAPDVVVEVVGHAGGGRGVAVAGFCLPFQMNTKVATIHFAIKKGLGKILTFEEAGHR